VRLSVHRAIAELPRAAWDALVDPRAAPFTSWGWLEALEHSGCAVEKTGWRPRHLALWQGERLVAAAPAYIKEDSDGDFSRDWGWAEGAARAGIAYYPKLSITVPFTPCTGPRLLVHRDADRPACLRALIDGARAVAADERASSLHVLFPTASEADELAALGLVRRVSFQYHWRNEGYRAPGEFLARFDSKRRNAAKRERAAPAAQGIAITTVRGAELAQDRARWARDAFQLHRSTVDKLMWGRRWLNEKFYQRVFEHMPDQVEVVAARRDGQLVAGAFNVSSQTRLYGRYWGCFEEHKFLHFNVCLYHSIDDCIARGLSAFEGGAGGEHKLTRGFEPAETFSSHLFLEPRLARPLAGWIAQEATERAAQLARWREESPILRHPATTER
jgi:predicted N-acyltransferase